MSVKLIVDTGCDLNQAQADKLGVILIPMTIHFGSREFRAGVDLSNNAFYTMLAKAEKLPTTSQPTPYDFETAYQTVKASGDEAVVLCVSSALSGTYQSAMIAAADYSDCIHVVDTKAVTVAQRLLLDHAIALRDHGASAKEIAAEINRKKADICVFGAVETLEYLIKGGRLSKAAGTVGSMLGIRPVLCLTDGALTIAGKARGAKGAISMTHDLISQTGVDFSMPIGIGYTGTDPQVVEPYLNAPNSVWQGCDIPLYNVGSTVGTHAGPGLYLAAFFKKT